MSSHLFKKVMTLTLALVLSPGFAGPVSLYMQHFLDNQADKKLHSTKAPALYFDQLIDHEHPALGTFKQRYFVDESYSDSPDSPVLYYICGESACSANRLNGAIKQYASKLHAKMVALEHRYYGKSLPKPSLSTEDLSYLTTQQALDDLAYFERFMRQEKQWDGQWIAIGGSYAGSLAAYYRMKYPYLVAGAIASSAPVRAKENFFEYDGHISQRVGPDCAERMRSVVRTIESSLDDPEALASIKQNFMAQDIKDPLDFLYFVADVGATAVQYGMKDRFCRQLAMTEDTLSNYASFAVDLLSIMGEVNAAEMTVQGAMSENPQDYETGVGVRSWYYQSCEEYGYWQTAHPNPQVSTRSSLINLDYHHQLCQRLFGMDGSDPEEFNTYFYDLLLHPWVSNIYFPNGEEDPWSNLSLSEKNGNADNPSLTYFLIKGAAHCDDLHQPFSTDSKELLAARELAGQLLEQWLAS